MESEDEEEEGEEEEEEEVGTRVEEEGEYRYCVGELATKQQVLHLAQEVAAMKKQLNQMQALLERISAKIY